VIELELEIDILKVKERERGGIYRRRDEKKHREIKKGKKKEGN